MRKSELTALPFLYATHPTNTQLHGSRANEKGKLKEEKEIFKKQNKEIAGCPQETTERGEAELKPLKIVKAPSFLKRSSPDILDMMEHLKILKY